jgi:hypothetical protein
MPLFAAASGTSSFGFQPTDHNMVGWTFDPEECQGGTLLASAAGTLNLIKFRAAGSTITNALMHFTAGGATLTGTYAALFTAGGALLAGSTSADQSTSWQSGGSKTITFGTPQSVTPGSLYYYGFFIATAVTMPTITRALNSSTAITNIGLSAPNFRYATTADTALTATMPNNFGAQTGTATAFWVGFS